jgi:biotin transport system substrate-specific component
MVPPMLARRFEATSVANVTRDAAVVVSGSALIALAAQVAVPLPFSPVPVTGQTFAVLTLAGSLGLRLGTLAVALYVVEGLAGLPVFAGGASGFARLAGPTGGYLVGFIGAAAVIGALVDRGWGRGWRPVIAMVLGEVVLYACGLAWLARFPLQSGLLQAGLLPFLVGDAYKLVAAVAVVSGATRIGLVQAVRR